MKNKVYIFDLIGSYSGMHYYDNVFAEILINGGYNVEILSNYKDDFSKKAFIPLIFGKNRVISFIQLLWVYAKFLYFVSTHNRKTIYIYMAYGMPYDIPFFIASKYLKNFYVDIHEIHALKYADNSTFSKNIRSVYRKCVKKIIYHSDRTKNLLAESGYKGAMLFVSHFKYAFNKDCNIDNVSPEIIAAFSDNAASIKLLFFGNLSIIKGIDIVVECFKDLSVKYDKKVFLIIAGKNFDNTNFSELKQNYRNIYVFDRHINDDELIYFYQFTDYVLLPYRKSSQSGIVEMAAFFKKPMILSDITYFKSFINKFSSFGILSSIENYQHTLENIIDNPTNFEFYKQADCDRNELKREIEFFMKEFGSSIVK